MTECPQMTHMCALTTSGVRKGPHKHEIKPSVDGSSEDFPPGGVCNGQGSVRTAGVR